MKLFMSLGVALLLAWPGVALAKTEIHFWHAMTGALGEALETQVKQFNESQGEYEVKPLRKGSYAETLTAARRTRRTWSRSSRWAPRRCCCPARCTRSRS
jgi:sn-glycerol 3-phosphate transport system substrate-binding protein